MKRTVRILALVLLLVMAVTALASCSKQLSGSYEYVDKDGVVNLLVFDKDEFIFNHGSTQLIGNYKIQAEGENYRIVLMYDETVTPALGSQKHETPLYVGGEEGVPLRITDAYIVLGTGIDAQRFVKK